MIDHLSLGVRDLGAARLFYDALLTPLGHAAAHANDNEIAYGPGGMAPQLFLYPATPGAAVAGSRTHVAFTATSVAAADAAFEAAIGAGASVVRSCGLHPDIGPTYYGGILFDPDGNKLEVVVDHQQQR